MIEINMESIMSSKMNLCGHLSWATLHIVANMGHINCIILHVVVQMVTGQYCMLLCQQKEITAVWN